MKEYQAISGNSLLGCVFGLLKNDTHSISILRVIQLYRSSVVYNVIPIRVSLSGLATRSTDEIEKACQKADPDAHLIRYTYSVCN